MRPLLRRAPAVAGGLIAAVALVFVGGLFGLNGWTWDWWQRACFVGAILLVVSVLGRPRLQAAAREVSRVGLLAAAAAGTAVLVAALAIMRVRFSDGYDGSAVWPDTLATLGWLGFAASTISLAAYPGRSG